MEQSSRPEIKKKVLAESELLFYSYGIPLMLGLIQLARSEGALGDDQIGDKSATDKDPGFALEVDGAAPFNPYFPSQPELPAHR